MNYEEALNYIHAVQWAGHKPGLTRTRTLLAALGDPHKQLKFIHVAGTNGKGSTAAMLASCLQAAGYRVGLYTSPFINRFNERIQVNGQQIPDEALVRLGGGACEPPCRCHDRYPHRVRDHHGIGDALVR